MQLNALSCDILLVLETWLAPGVPFIIPGYPVFRKDRVSRAGGVAIIINNNLKFSVLRTNPDLEFVAVKLEHPSLIVGAVYFTPDFNLTSRDIQDITHTGSPYIIGGDLNAKHPYWHNVSSNRKGTVIFKHMMRSNMRIIASSSPTYFQSGYRPSFIDFFITDLPYNFLCEALNEFGTSHRPNSLTMTSSLDPSNRALFNSNVDWAKYKDLTLKWFIVHSFSNVTHLEETISSLNQFLLSQYYCSISSNTSNLTNVTTTKTAYANDVNLMSFIKLRRRYRKLHQISADSYFLNIIKDLNKVIRHRISIIRQNAWKSMLNGFLRPDPTFWKTYRSQSKANRVIPPPYFVSDNGINIYSHHQKADALATQFSNVHHDALNLTSSLEHNVNRFSDNFDWNSLDSENLDSFQIMSPKQIFDHVHKMKSTKAPGPDSISVPMLVGIIEISGVRRFGKSLRLSLFLNLVKILKFRLIIGRLVCCRLLAKNQQFGFRPSHSTIQQVARITQYITYNLNTRRNTAMVLLDLSKAFDTVWHKALLYKINRMGLPYSILRLFKSYLEERTCYVNYNFNNQHLPTVPTGVPQDDTAIYSASTTRNRDNLISRLQRYLDLVINYFKSWKLLVNPAKTEAIFFTRTNLRAYLNSRKLTIDGLDINWSDKVKYLGVILNHRLNWLRILTYLMCLRPILLYDSILWWNILPAYMRKRVQSTQSKILNIILNKPRRFSTIELYRIAAIPLIDPIIQKMCLKYVVDQHPNPLVHGTGLFTPQAIPYRVKVPFPLSLERA
ncbi:hypothetical protein KPH14_012230 [Odynerus spinipes]|uniref:Reverse transcriptase domain-containing protein n=1 Tax=Odynerus spinipes TaxID=1348599 RepID=A0AAD9VKN5_9HYME|nr:hypothetical protein KPH14_012230 [Odynerus spinipes]